MSWATERLDALMSPTVELVAVARTLKLGGLSEWSEGRVFKRWLPSEDVLNVDGSMFGGHLAALADQMLAFAAMSVLEDGFAIRTINLGLQFLKVGRAHPLNIRAHVVSRSRSLIAVAAEMRRDDGELIAVASAQQMIVRISADAS